MNRLQTEFARLYLAGASAGAGQAEPAARLVDEQGRVRAMVMELARPASWDVLGSAWHGVQRELALPAPAIAVSGVDGLQLWFSLAVPIPAWRAHAFLMALRARYLPDVDARRVRLLPAADASAHEPPRHAAPVPALQAGGDNWSAFVAPDLAAVFSDTPWLDIEPGEEGQTTLLRSLRTMDPAAFESACRRLAVDVVPTADPVPVRAGPAAGRVKPVRNLDELEFVEQSHGETFAAADVNVSRAIGAVTLGYSVTRVPAGKRAWPFHNHHANEEMFFVLSGTGTYRVGAETYPIRAGDFIAAPAGDRGTAHQIVNDSGAELRYVAVSTGIRPEIVEYPESDKFSASAGRDFGHVGSKSDAVDYWSGEK